MKSIFLSISLFIISQLFYGQNILKLSKGVIIKGEKYLDAEYEIQSQTFCLDTITIEIVQVFRKEIDYSKFYCRAFIQTSVKNNAIDELYYDNIEAVGSSYGICFSEDQLIENYIVGSKYGVYSGNIILIGSKGKIIKELGGNYFISNDRRYLISDWHSDLSGITVFDLCKDEIAFSSEFPIYLSGWYEYDSKYFSAEWNEKETENIYKFSLSDFSLSKTKLSLLELHKFNHVIVIGCKPN